MIWQLVSPGFWRTPDGRFDKLEVKDRPPVFDVKDVSRGHGVASHPEGTLAMKTYYTVFDWDYGKSARTFSVEEADSWAWQRAKEFPSLLTNATAGR